MKAHNAATTAWAEAFLLHTNTEHAVPLPLPAAGLPPAEMRHVQGPRLGILPH
jgi:hypothetical protein